MSAETILGGPAAYVPSAERRRVGHITPSSNTVLEPMTGALNASLPVALSHHYTRVGVDRISLAADDLAQFSYDRMLAAAELLADGDMDVIAWNGTSGSRSGLDVDRELCARITERTGAPATTATLALMEAMDHLGATTYALAVPYTRDVSARIVDVYAAEGLACAGSASAGIEDNRRMAFLSPDEICDLVRAADRPDAECVLVVCTGVAGAPLAARLERELGKPVIDSIAAVFWRVLQLLRVEAALPGWGALLDDPAAVTRATP